MRYENLGDQGKNSNEAINFMPKPMASIAASSPDWYVRLKKPEISDSKILPRNLNLNFGEPWFVKLNKADISDARILPRNLDLNLGQDVSDENKNAGIVTAVGTTVLVLLIYFLFLR